MRQKILALKAEIAHDLRWSAEFLCSAVVAEQQSSYWSQIGHYRLAECLCNAMSGHLNTAALYEQSAVQKQQQLAQLEKSW